MKFVLKGPFKENIASAMRGLGYVFKGDSFVRPARTYPRFHAYIKQNNDGLFFDLHLDQKRPVYKGATAHSGEYDGKLIEQEAEKIKQAFK